MIPDRRQLGAWRASLFGAAVLLVCFSAGAAIDKDGSDMAWWRAADQTREQRLDWWREARFGMFVHWGVYSYLGGTWEGRPVRGYAEHIQRILKIPIPEYRREVAGHFNPVQFDADQWIRSAKQAGMGYFIITAKHHDGFAMFESKASHYNIVEATPFKRDPMKELKAACLKQGLKFGFYYSQAFDWGEADAPGNDWDYDNPGGDRGLHGGRNWWESSPELLPKARKYVDTKAIPQILELIKNYDPDILWFDTPHKLPESENLRILKVIRGAKPGIVVNGRLVRGCGDYDSTADRPAEFAPHEGDWEGIPTTNESYGWNRNDSSHKPPAHFIQLLAKAAARGGNTLMNIGPMGDGRFAPEDAAILESIGKWWRVNGESIRGTSRTPLPVQAWGESTRKGNTLYLHVFRWPSDGKLVVGGLKSGVKQARLLGGTGSASLVCERFGPLDLRLAVPSAAPDETDSVIALEAEGEPIADASRLLQPAFGEDVLRVFDGQRQGTNLKFGPGKTRDAYLESWTRPVDYITWPVRLKQAASYNVALIYDAPAGSAGSTYSVRLGNASLPGTVQAGTNQAVQLGRVQLKPGSFEIQVRPVEIRGSELMRLRSVVLNSEGPPKP